jgi:hypothetical protein
VRDGAHPRGHRHGHHGEGVKLDLARLVAWKGEVVNKLTSGVGGS